MCVLVVRGRLEISYLDCFASMCPPCVAEALPAQTWQNASKKRHRRDPSLAAKLPHRPIQLEKHACAAGSQRLNGLHHNSSADQAAGGQLVNQLDQDLDGDGSRPRGRDSELPQPEHPQGSDPAGAATFVVLEPLLVKVRCASSSTMISSVIFVLQISHRFVRWLQSGSF